MRRFFWKTFAWFWLTVLLTGIALAASFVIPSGLVERRWGRFVSSILREEAPKAAEAFDTGGLDSLNRFTETLETRFPIRAMLFAGDEQGISDPNPEPQAREMAGLADGSRLQVREGWASQRAAARSGREYILVIQQKGAAKLRTLIPILAGPVIVAISGAAFCFALAAYVTGPIQRLRVATTRVADGHLDTRMSAFEEPPFRLDIRKWPDAKDEMRALERDFDHMAERLESLVASQHRLLGDTSHELRSPLARLTVALGLAKQHPEEVGECLARIGLEAERLDKLVGQLLTLSRIESRVDSSRSDVDLTNLVQEVASDADFEARAQGKRIELTTVPSIITATEELIRTALENVVRNAVRHTPSGSSVEIALEVSGAAIICVRDHGPGVPEDQLANIFLPFRHSEDGAGLGLAIADRAIRSHGGSISALNARCGGLMVEIQIPLR
jgi:two-component system sensor histidine kinase CpxA